MIKLHYLPLHSLLWGIWTHYRPQTNLREGKVFTCTCQSFCPRGVYIPAYTWVGGLCIPAWTCAGGVHPSMYLGSGGVHPLAHTPKMATEANGTHPTRMHSCFVYFQCYITVEVNARVRSYFEKLRRFPFDDFFSRPGHPAPTQWWKPVNCNLVSNVAIVKKWFLIQSNNQYYCTSDDLGIWVNGFG